MTYNTVLDFTTVRGISDDIAQDRDASNTDAYHNPAMTLIRMRNGFTLPSDNQPGALYYDACIDDDGIGKDEFFTNRRHYSTTEEVELSRRIGLQYMPYVDTEERSKEVQAYPSLAKCSGLLHDEDSITYIIDGSDLPLQLTQLYPNLF